MKSIQIKNYKNLKDFKIDSLTRVNLIVGKNNVGKSTLLEAISIFAAKGDINQLKNVLEIRGEGVDFPIRIEKLEEKEMERFTSLYTNRDFSAFFMEPIEIKGIVQKGLSEDISTLSIRMVKMVEMIEKDENGIEKTYLKIIDENNSSDYLDSNIIFGIVSSADDKAFRYIFGRRAFRPVSESRVVPLEYVRTSQIANERNPILFDKIALSTLEKELINALQIIEPRIEAINFLKDDTTRKQNTSRDDDRVPMIVFTGNDQRYRLSSMGDGINRILTIILSLLNCKDGLLLIDEIENGLHYSVQIQLWKIVFELSNALNVQVFATTHSNDCIKSFVEANKQQTGKLIRLENRDGNISTVTYDEKDELDYISTKNLEIR